MVVIHSKDVINKYVSEGWWDNITLIERFKRNVLKNPRRLAIIDPANKKDLADLNPERITYEELYERVLRGASFLLDKGIFKDKIVLVQFPNTIELVIAYLSSWLASSIISPIPLQWRSHEIRHVCNTIRPDIYMLIDKYKETDYISMAKDLANNECLGIKNIITLKEWHDITINYKIREDVNENYLNGNDIATIAWTSGTEADPKAAPLTHNNWGFLRFLYDGEKYQGGILNDGEVIAVSSPLINMAAIGVGLIPWIIVSGTLVLHHPFDPELFYKQLINEGVTFTLMVPAVVVSLLKQGLINEKLKLKYLAVGAAPPPPWTFIELNNKGIQPINIWGQNEGTGLFSTNENIEDLEKRARAFPWPHRNLKWKQIFYNAIETKIVDPAGNEINEPGQVGELCYKSPFTMAGYYNQPQFTKRSFDENGFFCTGDYFQVVDEKTIAFFDRKKDIVNRGGFKIPTAEVEDLLKKHPKILDAAVVGWPDQRLGEVVAAFVVVKQGETISLDEIKKFMDEQQVAKYKWPERLLIVEQIPRNPVGKVMKNVLREKVKELAKSNP
ncbi:acyl-CoA synthetase (AMP-forming)/AMP-acid ligase II [Caldisphaera lagunensis DSM 15908]|uniref:Acyl-CoA synthetase (AMP-forming)/AMP-acid ligase II n=1 Tax=Caldisphaera lagunensis (strain DSM 15908 / JCM 11604 / ANMR 0165 / IC-154) TaxID=1056495 RepID=L0A922_CALLD|nr:class I adenylate-forming enzyme family protein [Caldisphaera lagunensis]AFZ69924.1 acyl-CoA synthetase (AMP-forming)/AMP-acid ligase II [Caldisphaera lagunensis DSM 15908]